MKDSAVTVAGESPPASRAFRTLTIAAPVIFLLLWSGGFTVAKVGIHDADTITLLALRYACVLVLLLPFCLWLRPALPATRIEWLHLAVVGFLIQVVYFGAAWKAMAMGASAASVALITSLQPILVALVMPALSRERVGLRGWLGLFMGLSGSAIVIVGNSVVEVASLTAVYLSIAALLAMTIATIWEKRFGITHHPLTANTVQYAVGLAFTLPFAWATESMTINWTLPFSLALLYLVVANSILAISLLLMMIRNGEATRVSALFFLVPPVSAVIAWLVIDEPMAPVAWLGMAIAATGVWFTTRPARPAGTASPRHEHGRP